MANNAISQAMGALREYGIVAIIIAVAFAVIAFIPSVAPNANTTLLNMLGTAIIDFFTGAGKIVLLVLLLLGVGWLIMSRAGGGGAAGV